MSITDRTPLRARGNDLMPLMEQESDAVLVRRYLSGQDAAFEVIFRRYQNPIFGFVSRMVRSEDAHDLTQDVFCKAMRALHTYRGEAKFATWLYRIARNVCLNDRRHKAVIREQSLDEMNESPGVAQLPDENADVERIVETHETQRVVNDILTQLTEEQRLLITLRDFRQLSYDEIADVTGISLANVKSKLHRARNAFKERFKPHLELLREGR